jgi:hypothetical protein
VYEIERIIRAGMPAILAHAQRSVLLTKILQLRPWMALAAVIAPSRETQGKTRRAAKTIVVHMNFFFEEWPKWQFLRAFVFTNILHARGIPLDIVLVLAATVATGVNARKSRLARFTNILQVG